MVKIRKLYDMPEESKVKTVISGESRTQQHFKDECDINNIMAKYRKTGFLVDPLQARTRAPVYADLCGMPEFMEAQIMIAKANEGFDALPAYLRKRFGNDPRKFVEFCSDPDNREEMERLGLIEKKPELEPIAPVAVPAILATEPKPGE